MKNIRHSHLRIITLFNFYSYFFLEYYTRVPDYTKIGVEFMCLIHENHYNESNNKHNISNVNKKLK